MTAPSAPRLGCASKCLSGEDGSRAHFCSINSPQKCLYPKCFKYLSRLMLLVWLVTSVSGPWGHLQALGDLVGCLPMAFPGTSVLTTSTQGTRPSFGSAMPHTSPISALSPVRAEPSAVGSLSLGLTASQNCQGLSVPMGQQPSGDTASPGVPAAPHSPAPSWGNPTSAAPHKTPGFHHNPKWGARIASISLTWT